MKTPKHCTRTSSTTLTIEGVDVENRIYANTDVPIEDEAIDELKSLLEVQETARKMYQIRPDDFTCEPEVCQVNLSPDFHKGAGIPIGTTLVTKGMIIPQAVGGDINCGVRLLATNLSKKDVEGKLDQLEPILRTIFFEGGRNIPLTQDQRRTIICEGVTNLRKVSDDGIWKYWDDEQHIMDLSKTRHGGGFNTDNSSYGLDDYLDREEVSRDSQIGSIGGGNHFVEVQYVNQIHDKGLAYQLGLKKNQLVIMVHSGSVSVGYLCGGLYRTLVKKIYQKYGIKFPNNDIFPLPDNIPEFHRFWIMLHNAANFAYANRTFLGLMLKQGLSHLFKDVEMKLIYDTPHNLVWQKDDNGKYVHRKGTSPAHGWEWCVESGLDFMHGEPVLIPGSMGSSSFIMEGQGNKEALFSASHGAGRSLSRGKALKHDEKAFEEFLKKFRIITPIDPKRHDIKGRKDILQQWHDALKKEAPFAYKDVHPVVNTLRDANIASPVAEVMPILTLKGH